MKDCFVPIYVFIYLYIFHHIMLWLDFIAIKQWNLQKYDFSKNNHPNAERTIQLKNVLTIHVVHSSNFFDTSIPSSLIKFVFQIFNRRWIIKINISADTFKILFRLFIQSIHYWTSTIIFSDKIELESITCTSCKRSR